ncbi:thiamine pyrophosphate-dependent enzyme [Marivirga salinae]|uniref:Thiamine pyrophosphate-dependent enzyme n=1 Tax=Marivirga salinarum TaxID=3059078 RepID=A0AA51N9E5_9BACT|nr:thiamine pyrophosphate-dependent enzyme [Marivirga sp. BDSF4-3]WMN11008.1 thiamine pyrophosphate-dependent enzyme [Marivirga sp. BDSF4-3]
MITLKPDFCDIEPLDGHLLSTDDYASSEARWCSGCGAHTILHSVQKLCSDEQLPPEKTVFVSGIGCSSRFPHYMKTYGFHGLHGRAFPVASGVKFRRPDLNVFVITGDGDCCSIGAGHWVHAIRYNMKMVVLLFDNSIYGLTKKQTSPTSPIGTVSNTHPTGSVLPPINPIQATLGLPNVSFVAQTVDWKLAHLEATLKKAFDHPGLAFVRIVQRCPVWMRDTYEPTVKDPNAITVLHHDEGIVLGEDALKKFRHVKDHDPADIVKAREVAELVKTTTPIGLFYQNKNASRYDEYGAHNLGISVEDRIDAINSHMDKYAI